MTCKGVKNDVMKFSCKNINAFGTGIAFPASHRSTPCAASLGIPEPLSFALSGGEKNGLWILWPRSSDVLRPEDPQDSRSALCRQAHLFGSGNSSSRLSKVQKSEAGEAGMVCLLYTSPSPRDGLLSRMPSSA